MRGVRNKEFREFREVRGLVIIYPLPKLHKFPKLLSIC